jgi:hypothetical protein
MHLLMRGKKLRGEWILRKDKREEDSTKWLLIRVGEELPPISAKRDDTSVLSGRSMRKISEANDAQWQSNRPAASAKGSKQRRSRKPTEPAFIEPMQCKPVAVLPADDKWTFEIKFDGYRCIAVKRGSEVTLFSRNKKILNKRFPKIGDAVAALKGDFVLDGELEGVVAKRTDSVYEPGECSGAWIKHRRNKEQEFVVGGYIPGSHGFDALLVGVYENKRLMFVAKNGNLPVPLARSSWRKDGKPVQPLPGRPRGAGRVQFAFLKGAAGTATAAIDQARMKYSAVAAITNNLVAARFWMILAILFAGIAFASPYFTAMAMRDREKVVILDPGGTLIYAPLLGFEEAGELHAYHVRLACLALLQRNPVGPDLADLLKRLYLEPARKKAATMYQVRNPEFKERQIHQKVEVTKIDILDTREIKDGAGHSYEAVTVCTEGNLIRTGTLNKMEFREPVKFSIELLFVRNPDLLGNGRLPLVVQDFKYKETPL